jgi:SpoVK/Ycf46/Vps4 family AAA+-type ATPase
LALVQFIASKLGLSIYRVDPATVVSKYISETEKKLRQLFDAAHHERVILFLDEADALLMRPDSAIYPRGDFAQTHALTRLNC